MLSAIAQHASSRFKLVHSIPSGNYSKISGTSKYYTNPKNVMVLVPRVDGDDEWQCHGDLSFSCCTSSWLMANKTLRRMATRCYYMPLTREVQRGIKDRYACIVSNLAVDVLRVEEKIDMLAVDVKKRRWRKMPVTIRTH